MSSNTEALITASKQRAALYAFFSKIYWEEVERESLEKFKQSQQQVDLDDPILAEGYEKLKGSVEQIERDEKNLDELAADYCALFLGIGRRPAHPYESVYLSKDEIVMREPYHEVRRIFREEGMSISEAIKEPDDHVALELEFMASMCQRLENALRQHDTAEAERLLQVQKDFMTEHLGAWIPTFCDKIKHGSKKLDFYPSIAILTDRFIALEKEYLAEAKI